MWLPKSVREEGVFRCDATTLSGILKCMRYEATRTSLSRVPSGWQRNLGFGGALHAALDVRQKAMMRGEKVSQSAMDAEIEKAFAGAVLQDDEWLHSGRCREAVGLYCQQYPSEDFEIMASEVSAEKELGTVLYTETLMGMGKEHRVEKECRVKWQGKGDGIWRRGRHGHCAVKDTKSTTQLGDPEMKRKEFEMGHQLKMYDWLFSDREWGTIRENVVDLVVLRAPLAKVTAKSLPRHEFYRWVISYTDEQIEEAKRDALKVIGLWLTACAHHSEPPPMTGAPLECTWGKGCCYREVCEQRSEKDRMAWLSSGAFRGNDFNPMNM
jgi:hypothetical protein